MHPVKPLALVLLAGCSACQHRPLRDVQDGRLLVVASGYGKESLSHMRIYPDSTINYYPADASGSCFQTKSYLLRVTGDSFVVRLTRDGEVYREQGSTFGWKGDTLRLTVDPERSLPLVEVPGNPSLPVCAAPGA